MCACPFSERVRNVGPESEGELALTKSEKVQILLKALKDIYRSSSTCICETTNNLKWSELSAIEEQDMIQRSKLNVSEANGSGSMYLAIFRTLKELLAVAYTQTYINSLKKMLKS